jgi:hypothetical protein
VGFQTISGRIQWIRAFAVVVRVLFLGRETGSRFKRATSGEKECGNVMAMLNVFFTSCLLWNAVLDQHESTVGCFGALVDQCGLQLPCIYNGRFFYYVPWTRQLYDVKTLHLPGHPMITVMPRDEIKGTLCVWWMYLLLKD